MRRGLRRDQPPHAPHTKEKRIAFIARSYFRKSLAFL